MNFLFYVGIIIPTVITMTLFIVFIYCWFLQKARKEVYTKKYDPHGKMRRLGMSMDPPPPPAFCRMEDSLLLDNGEDNVAYDVSRSPSTEQDGRGRPMYHTYHDSGISAGLSPSQESEPRPGLAYRTCPDSGISGFGPQPSQSSSYQLGRACCQIEEPMHRQAQQVFGDHQAHLQGYVHQYNQQACQPQVFLHHNLVQASVHPTHGVCYGDDMNHPQSPQHYNPPLVHPTSLNLVPCLDRQISLVAHVHSPPPQSLSINQQRPLPFFPDNPGYQLQQSDNHPGYQLQQSDNHCNHANELSECSHKTSQSPPSRHSQDNAATTSAADNHFPHTVMPLSPANLHRGSYFRTQNGHSHPSSPIKPPRHSYRDGSAANNVQPTNNTADRPDSQASQSSTTDSEDSGFRSSHCAAHPNVRLNKQGNPLLKPFRRTKTNKTKNKHKVSSPHDDGPRPNGATPLITLNPQNLQKNMDNSNVKQSTSLINHELADRLKRTPLQNSKIRNNHNDRQTATSPTTSQADLPETVHESSPVMTHQQSPKRERWPLQSQSSNDDNSPAIQNIDLNEISTHLSWKYLHDLSSNNSVYPTASNGGGSLIQPCHQGIRPGQIHKNTQEQHMEMFGFSVV